MLRPFFIAATLWSTALPALAAEQPTCGQRAELLRELGRQYAESPVAMGSANNGGVIELLQSRGGSSWTIIVTMPNGIACLLAAGESWKTVRPPVADPEV